MAQLRDAITSEMLGEGTPEQMALLARELGRADVLFDGVESEHNLGAFDPDAVLQAHEETVAALTEAAVAETDPDVKADLERAVQSAQAVEGEAAEMAAGARERMDAARALADV